MERHENPDLPSEDQGQTPPAEQNENDVSFDEQQRTAESERAGDASESPAEQTSKP
jgi:hypothetical protein